MSLWNTRASIKSDGMIKRCIALIIACLCLTSCAANGKDPSPSVDVQPNETVDGSDQNGQTDGVGTEGDGTEDTWSGYRFIFRTEDDGGTLAVWWWNVNHFFSEAKREQYLDFLAMNNVNEIYLCYPNPDFDRLAKIVRTAGQRGMRVSLLSGDCWWIDKENTGENTVVETFLCYQKSAPADAKLHALHLDVEPHQRDDFSTSRDAVLQSYVEMVVQVAETVRASGERIEWDIPFWFESFTVTGELGESIPLLELLSKNADTLCLMSYRDSAEEILSVSEEEISACIENGCKVVLGVETFSGEGDHVSFLEEGKYTMYLAMRDVYNDLKQRLGRDRYGIAVHYLDTWFTLKEK